MRVLRFLIIVVFLFLFPVTGLTNIVSASIPAANWLWTAAAGANGPQGMAIDGSGNIYIAHYSTHTIRKYNSSGVYISGFGGYGTGNAQFKYPSGVEVDASGNIYVADTQNNQIKKFNSSYVWQWTVGTTSSGTTPGKFNFPHDIVLGPDGYLYVSDNRNYRIQVFDTNGTLMGVIGARGTDDGKFQSPRGIAFDTSNNMYVVDYELANVQKFDSNRNFVAKFGSEGTGPGQLKSPYNIAVDNSGNIYVNDTGNNRIAKFASNFTPYNSFGSTGSGNGQFSSPRGIAIDAGGGILISDYSNNRIQKFDYSGTNYQISSLNAGLDIFNTVTGFNVESTSLAGDNNASILLRLKDSSGLTLSDITADMSSDRAWGSVIGDSDRLSGKAYVHNLIGSPGAAATHALYVPVPSGRTSQSVRICPNATDLVSVNIACPGGVERTAGSYVESFGNIVVSQINNLGDKVTYWKIEGMTGSGGMAMQLLEYSGGGSGTVGDPYLVTTCSELQEMSYELDAVYALSNDIDCSATIGWNAGAGFLPVGNDINPFTGELHGNNHAINALFINKATDYAGLFGYIIGGVIDHVDLTNINYHINLTAGGLVGYMDDTDITDIHVSGNMVFSSTVWGYKIGGAIGYANLGSYIIDSSTNVNMDFSPYDDEIDWVGGFVGVLEGSSEVDNCSSSGNISTYYSSYNVGGFVGWVRVNSIVRNSWSSGDVVIADGVPLGWGGDSYDNGGFAGAVGWDGYWCCGLRSSGYIYNSYSTGDVYLYEDSNYDGGGFVGTIYNNSVIEDSYSTGNVYTGTSNNDIGGFVGFSRQSYGDGTDQARISRCRSEGNVYVDYDTDDTGGFAGTTGGSLIIEESYSLGNVYAGSVGNEYEYVGTLGGFVGSLIGTGTIRDSYSMGSVETLGESWGVGGFAGYISNTAVVERSASLGSKVDGYGDVAGFVGFMNWTSGTAQSIARNNYSRTNVESRYIDIDDPLGEGADAAGFIGWPGAWARMENNYATGSISMITNPIDTVNTTLTSPNVYPDTTMVVSDATNIVPDGYLILGPVPPAPFTTTLTVGVSAGAVTLEVADASGLANGNQIYLEFGVVGKQELVQIQTKVGNTLNLYVSNPTDFSHDIGASVRKVETDTREIVLVRNVVGTTLTVTREMGYSYGDDWPAGTVVLDYDLPTIESGSGGFAGYTPGANSNIIDSYWDTDTSGYSGSFAGTGYTTSQMKDISNFGTWDFTDIWGRHDSINDGYPFLPIDDATLASLSLSVGSLNPVFNRLTTSYTTTVNANSITFTPTAKRSFIRSMTMNGNPINSGEATLPQPLAVGVNPFTFQLTSFNGRVLSYTLNVTRNPGGNNIPNTPVNPVQFKADGLTIVPPGGTNHEPGMKVKFQVSDTDNPENLTPQMEIKQVGAPFNNVPTHAGATVTFTGSPLTITIELPAVANGHHHWQSRVCDDDGDCSNWVSYGGNPESEADIIFDVIPNTKPNVPGNPKQYKDDGITEIPKGGTSKEKKVKVKFEASDPDNPEVITPQIEIEKVGTPFDNIPTHAGASVTVNGSPATITIDLPEVAEGAYHWQTRTCDDGGECSDWISYGDNPESEADIIVDVPDPTPLPQGIPAPTPEPELEIINVRTETEGTEVEVCWDTTMLSTGYVRYGIGTLAYSTPQTTELKLLDHCVDIINLEENTRYNYNIIAHSGDNIDEFDSDILSASFESTFFTSILPVTGEVSCGISLNRDYVKNGDRVTFSFTTDNTTTCTLTYGPTASNLPFNGNLSHNGNLFSASIDPAKINHDNGFYTVSCTVTNNNCSASDRLPAFPADTYSFPITSEQMTALSIIALLILIIPRLIAFPKFWLYAFVWAFLRRKFEPWGIIYDLKTKKPVPFAVARIYDSLGKMLKQTVSDLEGKFGFILDKGSYSLNIEHSSYLEIKRTLEIRDKEIQYAEDIGLAQNTDQSFWQNIKIFMEKFTKKTFNVVWFIGFVACTLATVTNPVFLNIAIMVVYLAQAIILFFLKPARNWGVVYEVPSDLGLEGAFVRVQDVTQGRQIEVQMSDEKGRFGFKLNKGEYLLIPSLEGKKVVETDLQSTVLASGTTAYKYNTEDKNADFGMS